MTQKFINYLQKTQRKEPLFKANDKPKKFFRKKSANSEHSSTSKLKKEEIPFQPQFIKANSPHNSIFNLKHITIDLDNNEKLNMSAINLSRIKVNTERNSKAIDSKNYGEIESLKVELDLRTHQMQMLSGELQRIRAKMDDEKSRKYKLEEQKRQITRQVNQLKASLKKTEEQNKKKQNQIGDMKKHIEFLEKMHYSEKVKKSHSYRQQYLGQELKKTKQNLIKSQSIREIDLQKQLQQMFNQRYTAKAKCKALQLDNSCLLRQVQQLQHAHKQSVMSSVDYCKLRDKYKHLLKSYNEVKVQHRSLKARMGLIYSHQDSSLQIIISSSSNQELQSVK